MTHHRWLWVVLAPALAAGCLQKDTSSTLYLDPGGRLTWVVVERDVRSDSESTAERDREEREYVDAVDADRHPTAEAFRVLGGLEVRTTWLRDRRPWAVIVEATFESLDAPVTAALTACGVSHASATSVRDGITTWRLDFDEPGSEREDDPACTLIVDGLSDAIAGGIVLTRGRFVGAEGFDLGGPGPDRAALALDASGSEAQEPSGTRTVSLSWVGQR